jgi:hypothetical protein
LANKIAREKPKQLHYDGASVTKIGKQKRVSKVAISKMLKKMGLAMAAVTTMELAPKIAADKINALERNQPRQLFSRFRIRPGKMLPPFFQTDLMQTKFQGT